MASVTTRAGKGSRLTHNEVDANFANLNDELGGYTAMGASAIDLTTDRSFSKTISGTTTLTISNCPSSGQEVSFLLELTNGGSQTVNWPTGTDWPGGAAPTLTAAGVDLLAFRTRDGGTTWHAVLIGAAFA